MKQYWSYFKYVVKHKWFVFLACMSFLDGNWYFSKKESIYLIWRSIIHDWHKFLPNEFIPYANHFYNKDGSKKSARNKDGYYKPTDTGDKKFDWAWFLHQKKGRHHWQWWILPEDTSGCKSLLMDFISTIEMTCDWYGASKAQEHGGWEGVRVWYNTNKDKMQINSLTRYQVEFFLRNK